MWIGTAVGQKLRQAIAGIAMYAEGLGGIALFVVIDQQNPLAVIMSKNMRHADSGDGFCNAAFEVDDGDCFHKITSVS